MGFTITGGMQIGAMNFVSAGGAPPEPTDAYFNYVAALLSPTSPTNTFVTDASTNNFNVTIAGDTKPNYFSPYATVGYYGSYFDGSATSLQIASNTAFDLAGVSWTAECWVRPSGDYSTYRTIFTKRVTGSSTCSYQGYLKTSTGVVSFYNGSAEYNSSTTLTPNVWSHCAWVYDGTNINIYVNGTSVYSAAVSLGANNSEPLVLGGVRGIGEVYQGYLSNFRLVKGTAVYTSTFTPSTSPLTAISGTSLLTLQNNRHIDNSSNAFAITTAGSYPSISQLNPFSTTSVVSTYGSGYFDQSGDYLKLASNAAFAMGTGSFTWEAWIYPVNFSAYQQIFSTRPSNGSSSTAGSLAVSPSSGVLVWYTSGFIITTSSAPTLNSWNHVALVRNGTAMAVYINGVSVGTATNSDNLTAQVFSIGANNDGSEPFAGYISDVRVVNGTAVYTTAFTPPTTSLTAVSGTSLLTLQNPNPATNSMVLDSSGISSVLVRSGNASTGMANPFGSNWSAGFDGSGDYLTAGTTASNFLCTGSATGITATFEAWVFITAYSTGGQPWQFSSIHAKDSTYFNFGIRNGAVRFYWYDGAYKTVDSASTSDVPLSTWTHVAVTINGSTIKIYVNGALSTTSATYTGVNTGGLNQPEYIGAEGGGPTYFSGYISNYRLSNTVVYASAFVPSTAPLAAVSGTQLLTCQSAALVDNSSNAFAITRYGEVLAQKFSPFANASSWSAGTWGSSVYLDGTGDYLYITGNPVMNFRSSNFTVECWVKLNALPTSDNWPASWNSTMTVICTGTVNAGDGFNFIIGSTKLLVQSNDTGYLSSATHGMQPGGWYHLACVRSGNTIYFYVNGVAKGSIAFSGSVGVGTNTYIGAETGQGSYVNGYIAGLRVVNGTAVYTGAFTPSTTPLTTVAGTTLLFAPVTGQGDFAMINDFESAGDAKITTDTVKYGYTSMYFDGSGDYLKFPDSPALEPGGGSLTWEMWINTTSSTQYATIYSRIPGGFGAGMWSLMINVASATTGDVGLWIGDYSVSSPLLQTTGVNVRDGAWHFITVVRNGSSWVLYVDGVSRATATWAGTVADLSTGPWIAADQNNGRAYVGYISDLRITPGVARYTTGFTPPTTYFPTS